MAKVAVNNSEELIRNKVEGYGLLVLRKRNLAKGVKYDILAKCTSRSTYKVVATVEGDWNLALTTYNRHYSRARLVAHLLEKEV